MSKDLTRRQFLGTACKALTAGVLIPSAGLTVLSQSSTAETTSQPTSWDKVWEGKEWGFVVDTEKCIGCGSCVKACKKENHVPEDHEVYRTWVERYVETDRGEVQIDSPKGGQEFPPLGESDAKQFFVPKLCNQCHNAPCTQVCPVGATYKTGDGVILVDQKRCVGCRYCIQACPYGARFLHPETKVVDKCNWCYHRVQKGMRPACATVCPVGARKFGNLKDPESEVSKIIEKERIRTLKPEHGTKPFVYYIGLDEVVV
ncbi:MAG: 4Fe-4S dicluster domain-containing protein [Thermincola sp.]|nr:4Fe-4S dicluster domain-containing protein [Thermincola sp.]MDT3703837.1 4Fe-4S dicluster domain-containing protein [Thermincola sp.]